MSDPLDIGVLFSRSGGYALLADEAHAGVMAGIASVNEDPALDVELRAIERDPEGRADVYAARCEDILRNSGARHIFGCTTSWSRKEVIPVLERRGAMLWYTAPYEGFEANDRVVYLHACPNQHLVPLLAYALPRFGRRAFLVGSNYIWGWEVNRLARDIVSDASGEVLGERYLPIGDVDVGRLIAEVRATRPDFVLNNLIGPSSYAFIRAYAALGAGDPDFRAERRPILSCNLTEAELSALDGAGEGHLSVGPYFRDAGAHAPSLGGAICRSSYYAAAFSAVRIFADAVRSTGDASPDAVARCATARRCDTPMGPIAIDPQTQHASLPVRIGRIRGAGFEVLQVSEAPVAPDPYLSRYDPHALVTRPALRVVP
ncbi:transporter substrate-binding protein [Aurantimonas sp. MSK8Z-1]|uniref:transporter substrate-binding protein n=1 Tax=Mangrovibrevibacter kandeliae TaxID=2968473 RepID=UPI0021187E49|nr:transporter substrate-binding protein [Aurantimonas sp. MSK8Z-1]MCW4113828.1 transporter substrate-binding protein [Aurantimonas sp. MSK8Z-1]